LCATIKDFSKSDHWKAALGEDPRKAIKRFLNDGVIEQANLEAILDYKYKVPELKGMLGQRSLPVSGPKRELIAKLVEADPEGMKKGVQGLTALKCSEKGRVIVEQYLALEDEKQAKVEQQVLNALREHKFREAGLLADSFEGEQVFSRCGFYIGVGLSEGEQVFPRESEINNEVTLLEIMFRSKPKILAPLTDEQLEQLRIAAGMMCVWVRKTGAKNWLPPDFKTGLTMDNDAAARMILFHACHQIRMAEYRKTRWKTVKILLTDDSCDECRKLAQRKFRLDQVPELPYEKCTSKMGCRCETVVADFSTFD